MHLKNIYSKLSDGIIASLFAGVFILFAFVFYTNFTFDLTNESRYPSTFFNMWNKMVDGDVGIDREYLPGETFLISGKTIGYFLPFPAIVRGFNQIFGIGKFPVPSILMGLIVYAFSVFYIFKQLVQNITGEKSRVFILAWYPFFLLPAVTLFVESSVYWEAIVWGLSLFMLEICLYCDYKTKGALYIKFLLCLISSLTLFTRPTYAVASLILILLMFISEKQKTTSIKNYFPYFIFFTGLICLGSLNYARWGSPFEFSPLKYHEQLIGTERGRLASINPSLSIKRIPEAFNYYFMPDQNNFQMKFPYVVNGNKKPSSISDFDYIEWSFPITLVLPFNLILVLAGLYFGLKNKSEYRMPILIAFIPSFLILTIISMALRYRAEFFPFIIFCSMIGLIYLKKILKSNLTYLALFFSVITFLLVTNSLLVERLLFFNCDVSHNPQVICKFYR